VLEAAFVLLKFSSPSRRIFIGSHSLPPSLVRRIGPSATPEQRVNHQLRRRIRHLECNLRDITARCNAERERRMSLEALVGGKIITFI
jgi:hypothetical protein